MKVVLLTVLGALCVLTEGAHILPQKDFDLQRFAGKWHRVGLAYNSDWFRQYRDSLKISVGVLVPTETGSVNVTMWQLKSSGCHSVTFLYEKTDTPGHFKYFSTRSNALKDITIVDTNYDEYALVLKNNPTGNTQVAMYGRKEAKAQSRADGEIQSVLAGPGLTRGFHCDSARRRGLSLRWNRGVLASNHVAFI
ncbi:prostaglandin-H2 D-isomerase [Huso huso]|uniref:Prostaglandin-H2 D-isomerase n=1 Tax=Huso huso TaxID=61971 RepID=A0ABR0Z7Y6_HUSHU